LAGHLDTDGYTVYEADRATAVPVKLSTDAVDALVLGELERPGDVPRLVRAVRAGELERVPPELPIITIGADDELTALRA
jgi:hypothetical protein